LTNRAAGNCAITSSGIMPARIPSTVALAPSDFAYSTIGLPSTGWKDSAFHAENQYIGARVRSSSRCSSVVR
jgi:hypothetical protein